MDIEDKFWHVLLVVWFGSGGPSFQSFMHCSGEVALFGGMCPPEVQLPSRHVCIKQFYEYFKQILDFPRGRRKDILSSDGCQSF